MGGALPGRRHPGAALQAKDDKAKAEVAVQVVERWILAACATTPSSPWPSSTSVSAPAGGPEQSALQTVARLPPSAFEQLDRPALRPLPSQPYRFIAIKPVKVNIDYHVQLQGPRLLGAPPVRRWASELHASDTLVETYFRRQLVATHPRKYRPGFTTNPAHMPKRHRAQQQWTPGRLKRWAADIGPIPGLGQRPAEGRDHPEQAYKVCLGLLNLSKQYPPPGSMPPAASPPVGLPGATEAGQGHP